MTDPRLPENSDDWPRDPFVLLGVSRAAGADDVRRAYARLVRQFRPDEFPRQFQRIRAAYEQATQWLQWQRSDEDDAEEKVDEVERAAGDASASNQSSNVAADDLGRPEDARAFRHDAAAEPRAASKAVPAFTSRLDAAWNVARDGQPAEGLRLLHTLREERPDDPEPYLRLFWLHVLVPELDLGRFAGEWLIQGLKATGLSPRLLHAYREELRRSSSLVKCQAGVALLEVAAPSARLIETAGCRWAAAARVRAWEVIEGDLDRLRTRLLIDEPDEWVRLLFAALDQAVWSPDGPARRVVARCQRELAGCRDRELKLASDFERNAFLLELAGEQSRNVERALPEALRRLIRNSWTQSPPEWQRDLHLIAEDWVQRPSQGLDLLTRLAYTSAVSFEQLWRAVRQSPIPWQMRPSQERVEQLAPRMAFFVAQVSASEYAARRLDLLEFCIHEMVWPDEIIQFLVERSPVVTSTEMAANLHSDAPLQCLHHACMAFLAAAG